MNTYSTMDKYSLTYREKIIFDLLKLNIGNPVSREDICKEIGTTEKGVAGRIDRAVKKGIIERREKLQVTNSRQSGVIISVMSKLNAPKVTPMNWHYKPLGRGVPLVEVKSNECHFPCDGGVYCAAKKTKGMYCAAHYDVVYKGKGGRL